MCARSICQIYSIHGNFGGIFVSGTYVAIICGIHVAVGDVLLPICKMLDLYFPAV